VIDDVDEALLVKIRAGVTHGTANVDIVPSTGDVSLNKGQNRQLSGLHHAQSTENVGDAAVVFTQLLKATMTEQERTAGNRFPRTV
jgi:hypothetical protein